MATMRPFWPASEVKRLTNLSPKRTENGPDHEAEIKVEKRREQRGPVAGGFSDRRASFRVFFACITIVIPRLDLL